MLYEIYLPWNYDERKQVLKFFDVYTLLDKNFHSQETPLTSLTDELIVALRILTISLSVT